MTVIRWSLIASFLFALIYLQVQPYHQLDALERSVPWANYSWNQFAHYARDFPIAILCETVLPRLAYDDEGVVTARREYVLFFWTVFNLPVIAIIAVTKNDRLTSRRD